MFKNALVYQIDGWEPPTPEEIERRLDGACFIECSPTQAESYGWVAPRGDKHGALLERVGGQFILKLCTERKAVPAAVVKGQLDTQLDRIESETGRRPKGKAMREIKDQVVHDLLPRAFPKRASTPVWMDIEASRVLIGTGSGKQADGVATRLVELFPGLRLVALQTALAPATAMSSWLRDKEAPPGFSIDRECELKQPDSEKAAVRYARHTLDIDEVGVHISEGKLPTQLAMTWNSRVSFVLTDALTLKKMKWLDVAMAGSGAPGSAEDGFDADVALSTGDLAQLLPDLIDALGGPLVKQPAAPDAQPASAIGEMAGQDRLAA
jgi:recombination associated protein RdgC